MVLEGQMKVSVQSLGRFGTTITSLADLNGDGLRDVAIGAPLEDDNRGTVYIYLGDKREGIRSTYNQVRRVVCFGVAFWMSHIIDNWSPWLPRRSIVNQSLGLGRYGFTDKAGWHCPFNKNRWSSFVHAIEVKVCLSSIHKLALNLIWMNFSSVFLVLTEVTRGGLKDIKYWYKYQLQFVNWNFRMSTLKYCRQNWVQTCCASCVKTLLLQRIMGQKIKPDLRFFGQSIDGDIDLGEDGLTDIVVGSYGAAVVLRYECCIYSI